MVLPKEIDISIVVIVGTLSMGMLALCIILFYAAYQKKLIKQQTEHQHQLLEATIQTQESERKRFSEDLHDDLGALLSVIRLKVSQAEYTSDVSHIGDVKTLLDEAINNTKKISRALSPIILEKFGLIKLLQELSEKATTTGKLEVSFDNTGLDVRLNNKTELGLFRIVQELLNNLINHTKATRINIVLNIQHNSIVLIVKDDEEIRYLKENHHATNPGGLGLNNIKSRIEMLNASIIHTKEEKGNCTKIVLKF